MKGRYGSVGLALIGLGLAFLPARGTAAPPPTFVYHELARLDTKAPGGGMLVNDFEPGRVSPQGEIAFVVDYDRSNSEAIYLASNGTPLIPIVEPGKPVGAAAPDWTFVPDGPIQMILSPVGMNAAGDVAFGCDVQKKGVTDIQSGNFLWIRRTGLIQVLNLPDSPAPDHGTFGNTHGSTWVTVNDQDDAAFAADVSDPQGNVAQGVFLRTGGLDPKVPSKVITIARAGDKLADGSTFASARRPNINNAGAVVFEGTTDKDSDVRLYQSKDGTITTLVEPNKDLTGIGKLTAVKRPRLNNKGQMMFLGSTDAGWGLYMLADSKFTALLVPGADLGDGAKLSQVRDKDGSAALADSGNAAAVVELANNAGFGIYLLRGNQVVPVEKDGGNLAGLGALDASDDEHVALNGTDQIAFQGKFTDGHTGLILATPSP